MTTQSKSPAMTSSQRDFFISKIIYGKIIFKYNGSSFCIGIPTQHDKYLANKFEQEILHKIRFEDMLTEDDLKVFLNHKLIWLPSHQLELDGLNKDIEEIKVQIYNLTFQAQKRAMVRHQLQIAKQRVEELELLKHSFDMYTKVGFAKLSRFQFMLCKCIEYSDGSKYSQDLWNKHSGIDILDAAIIEYNNSRLNETQLRLLSRTEPWISIWNVSSKNSDVFGCLSSELTDEQKTLIAWSKMYDSVNEHPDTPHESVINDDDMLDGWLIIQRRKRETDQKQKEGNEKISNNPKIQNADEIFLVADTMKDAKAIDGMNHPVASHIKKQRASAIRKAGGPVSEMDMPDTQQKLQMEMNKAFGNQVRNN